MIRKLTTEIPLGRPGNPDDIARFFSFLAGPDGAWVSGQMIRTNGGRK
jgi:3-oxoacyl-[acyl-carrier protein] reductase